MSSCQDVDRVVIWFSHPKHCGGYVTDWGPCTTGIGSYHNNARPKAILSLSFLMSFLNNDTMTMVVVRLSRVQKREKNVMIPTIQSSFF